MASGCEFSLKMFKLTFIIIHGEEAREVMVHYSLLCNYGMRTGIIIIIYTGSVPDIVN